LWRVRFEPILPDVIELLAERQRAESEITLDELTADPPTEEGLAFARAMRAKGAAGFAYPSVRNKPNGICAVLFLEHAEPVMEIEPADDEWLAFVREAGLGK
jgi:hypothetical protein